MLYVLWQRVQLLKHMVHHLSRLWTRIHLYSCKVFRRVSAVKRIINSSYFCLILGIFSPCLVFIHPIAWALSINRRSSRRLTHSRTPFTPFMRSEKCTNAFDCRPWQEKSTCSNWDFLDYFASNSKAQFTAPTHKTGQTHAQCLSVPFKDVFHSYHIFRWVVSRPISWYDSWIL